MKLTKKQLETLEAVENAEKEGEYGLTLWGAFEVLNISRQAARARLQTLEN